MKDDFKTVLITGTSSGIGDALARYLLDKGWKVYASARNVSDLEALKSIGAYTLQLDVTDQQTIDMAVAAITEDSGKLDAVINNAGFGLFGVFEYISDEMARKQLETNVLGLAKVVRSTLPLLRNSGAGRIVNISSLAGIVSLPLGAWYSVSKFAVEAISDSLRMELASQNIKVISIQPGPVSSNFGQVTRKKMVIPEPDGIYDKLIKNALSFFNKDFQKKNHAQPTEVAHVVWKALTAKKPKARYRITLTTHVMVAIKWLLPDTWLDAIFIRKIKLK